MRRKAPDNPIDDNKVAYYNEVRTYALEESRECGELLEAALEEAFKDGIYGAGDTLDQAVIALAITAQNLHHAIYNIYSTNPSPITMSVLARSLLESVLTLGWILEKPTSSSRRAKKYMRQAEDLDNYEKAVYSSAVNSSSQRLPKPAKRTPPIEKMHSIRGFVFEDHYQIFNFYTHATPAFVGVQRRKERKGTENMAMIFSNVWLIEVMEFMDKHQNFSKLIKKKLNRKSDFDKYMKPIRKLSKKYKMNIAP